MTLLHVWYQLTPCVYYTYGVNLQHVYVPFEPLNSQNSQICLGGIVEVLELVRYRYPIPIPDFDHQLSLPVVYFT